MYVYLKSNYGVWSVGFYDPAGKWHLESEEYSAQQAAQRVAWLNGKKISVFETDRLSFKEFLTCLEIDLWDSNKKHTLGRLKNVIIALARDYNFVDQVNEKVFLNYRSAGKMSWILFQDLVSKAKQKQKEFLNL